MDMLSFVRDCVSEKRYQISAHAEYEREAEGITLQYIAEAVAAGELLEDYPDDRRGHSCLILGFASSGTAIHTVWGVIPDGRARLITVYIPQLPKWISPRERRKG